MSQGKRVKVKGTLIREEKVDKYNRWWEKGTITVMISKKPEKIYQQTT